MTLTQIHGLWWKIYQNAWNSAHIEKIFLPHHKNLLGKLWCIKNVIKYSSVSRENRCPPPPKPVYGGSFSHEAVTLKIKSRSLKSNKLLILPGLYRLAFGNISSNGSCDGMQTNTFWLKFGGLSLAWPWKLAQGHQNLFNFLSCPNVTSMQIWLKSASCFMRYWAHKHLLAQIWQFKSHSDLEK